VQDILRTAFVPLAAGGTGTRPQPTTMPSVGWLLWRWNHRCELFGYVHTLILDDCHGITDVGALGSVHKLMGLSRIMVRERGSCVRDSYKLHKLVLWKYHGITDVSALGSVHTLTLENCAGITDVSTLDRLHTLRM
jgi:hypothetical protein